MRLTLKSLQAEIQAMNSKVQKVDSELHSRVDRVVRRSETFEKEANDRFKENEEWMQRFRKEMTEVIAPYFYNMEKMVGDLDTRVDGLERKVDGLDKKLDEHVKAQLEYKKSLDEHIKSLHEYHKTHDRIVIDHEGRIRIIEANVHEQGYSP